MQKAYCDDTVYQNTNNSHGHVNNPQVLKMTWKEKKTWWFQFLFRCMNKRWVKKTFCLTLPHHSFPFPSFCLPLSICLWVPLSLSVYLSVCLSDCLSLSQCFCLSHFATSLCFSLWSLSRHVSFGDCMLFVWLAMLCTVYFISAAKQRMFSLVTFCWCTWKGVEIIIFVFLAKSFWALVGCLHGHGCCCCFDTQCHHSKLLAFSVCWVLADEYWSTQYRRY